MSIVHLWIHSLTHRCVHWSAHPGQPAMFFCCFFFSATPHPKQFGWGKRLHLHLCFYGTVDLWLFCERKVGIWMENIMLTECRKLRKYPAIPTIHWPDSNWLYAMKWLGCCLKSGYSHCGGRCIIAPCVISFWRLQPFNGFVHIIHCDLILGCWVKWTEVTQKCFLCILKPNSDT